MIERTKMYKELINNIPQTGKFRFVDEIIKVDNEESRCLVKKHIKKDDFYFEDHFPGNPIMPGCLMIECMAQSAEVLILAKSSESIKFKKAYLVQVKNSKFMEGVVPNSILYVECKLIRKIGKLIEIDSSIENESGKLVATGSMILYAEME